MIQVDDRLHGERRYIHTGSPLKLMMVPDEVRKCAVFLGMRLADGSIYHRGTGALVARRIRDDLYLHYLVTAKHTIDNIRDKGVDQVQVRVNTQTGSRWIGTPIGDWFAHPDDPTIDVAASGFMIPEDADHKYFPLHSQTTSEYITENEVGPGEETLMVGLFGYHQGVERAIPIVRVGNIAAMPGERVRTRIGMMEAYLIESRSLRGLSGSPVFLNLGLIRQVHGVVAIAKNPVTKGGFYTFLGLVHGHFRIDGLELDDSERDSFDNETLLNAGIAIVTPAWKMMEVLDQPMIRNAEERAIKKHDETKMPQMDDLDLPGGSFTQADFEEALRRASQKLPPSQSDEER